MRNRRAAEAPTDSGLPQRVRALARAAELNDGRVAAAAVAEAERVVTQVDRRLALSGEATVVALAGATGSGKSSLFNVLSGTTLATVGVRRPTTATPLAARWGDLAAGELLDWLEVNRRHGVHPEEADGLAGLVLLDLPDHDSTELSHRLEVDRLVQLVDVLVWVVDPQKYADAALHDRYLKPLASHADVMLVVLNQADRLSEADRDRCVADLRTLLAAEGLPGVPVLAASAETGYGVAELRTLLAGQVADKQAAARRLAADVSRAADQLAVAAGTGGSATLSPGSIERLHSALAEAAGVPAVLDAVGQAWRRRGALATGWPLLAWLATFRPDPLRRLHLGRGSGRPAELEEPVGRSSLPQRTGVQQAKADSAIRDLADEAGRRLSRGWADAVKSAARSQSDALADALDRQVAGTDLDLHRHRRWWQLVRVLQWLLIGAIAVGLGWLGLAFLLTYLRLPPLPEVTWWGYPPPLLLIVGGVVAGLLVAGLSRIGVEVGARRRIRGARRALMRGVEQVTSAHVLEPVRAELERYDTAQAALLEARSS